MSQTNTEAETNDEAQILWGLITLVLAGILAVVIILHVFKLPFPGTVFFAQDKTYPAPTAPAVPGKKHPQHHVASPTPKPNPVGTPTQPPAAAGPTSAPGPVSSPTHGPTHRPAPSQGVGVPRPPAVPTPPAPKPPAPILVIPPILFLPSIGIG